MSFFFFVITNKYEGNLWLTLWMYVRINMLEIYNNINLISGVLSQSKHEKARKIFNDFFETSEINAKNNMATFRGMNEM